LPVVLMGCFVAGIVWLIVAVGDRDEERVD
jgi:hypothetical protein